jgi:hypothetical protein
MTRRKTFVPITSKNSASGEHIPDMPYMASMNTGNTWGGGGGEGGHWGVIKPSVGNFQHCVYTVRVYISSVNTCISPSTVSVGVNY